MITSQKQQMDTFQKNEDTFADLRRQLEEVQLKNIKLQQDKDWLADELCSAKT